MTTLSSSQEAFLPAVEESENTRINFRDSLKFFQEQLVINGANFPSPCQSGNNTLKKNGSFSFKENSQDKSKGSKDNDVYKEEIQSARSCKIAIPTVDTILESVRVLRAIQKSQEERGTFWNLNVSTKSDIDSYFQYKDDEITITNENQNVYSNQQPDKEKTDETDSMISIDTTKDTMINQGISDIEIKVSQSDTSIQKDLSTAPNSKADGEICSFWPSNSLVIYSCSETENGIKESPLPFETKNQYINKDYHKTGSECTEAYSTTESNIKCDEKQNDSILSSQLEHNNKHENLLENSSESESKIKNNSSSDERQSNENIGLSEQNDNFENILENFAGNVKNESDAGERQNENSVQLEQNNTNENLLNSTENDMKQKSDYSFDNNENNISSQSDKNKNDASENFIENKIESLNTITKACETPESVNEVCTDLLDLINFSQEDTTKEIILHELNTKDEFLKIETYEDTNTHKPDVFMMNGSLWKGSCSPNDRSFIKTEPNDSDSGFGTQRSASSLSPNNHSQMQKDSWSDSCSSHYASAECSPYQSLNSVFESSSGLSTAGETKTIENTDILSDLSNTTWENTPEKAQVNEKVETFKNWEDTPVKAQDHERVEIFKDQACNLVAQQINNDTESHLISDKNERNSLNEFSCLDSNSENAELDTEISYCNFITNYTIEKPCTTRTDEIFQTIPQTSEICENSEKITEKVSDQEVVLHEQTEETNKDGLLPIVNVKENEQDDLCDLSRVQKFTAASCDLKSIVLSLYTTKEDPAYQILPTLDEHEEKFEEELFILSRGAFSDFPEDYYLVSIEDSIVHIKKDSQVLCSLNMKYGEISIMAKTILEIDTKMGKFIHIQTDIDDVMHLKTRIEVNILKYWQTDCLQLVHYPLKCHQNVVIVDLGSCSTRAGILMDQPTLPSLFFPTICATNKTTGMNVYGMEALQSEVRQHSNLSFPVRPTIKVTKHTIDIDLLEGLFKKIFSDLKIDPIEYMIQICLPRNLSINAQTALLKLLLEDLKVKAVSFSNQALLTLYAHEVSTAVVVDIGERIDVLPVVDGFIVENGVTKLPHGGQRLIHHMKHGLAEKRISLSNDIDSFIVQYIIENLSYVAEDYEKEMQIANQYPDRIMKTLTLQPASSENTSCKTIALEEARFKIPEGLFNPDLWGLDSPGIHHLVQKAIQATGVDARKQIAENIYVSGGVTMLPGFVERLSKEMVKLSKTKIVPKVHASNYRYHCTYIGACKFAKMDVFPQVCVNLEDYLRNGASILKKCALCF